MYKEKQPQQNYKNQVAETPIKTKVQKKEVPKKTTWEATVDFFAKILDLKDGLDRKGTVEKIHKNIETKGANVWLLISAIVIASIGLDTNSPAVIIGAMLISPLMSPILGIGLSIGINDRKTLWLSVRHFLIAIVVSLITSVVYFSISPFGSLTSEIAGRISPTFLDVLVAFFGGIAGVVAITRKDLINAVPGVAIATALLPPLCVTGFGLANWNLEIAWGSFYLFFLNSTFVSLATYIIVRLLKFPYRTYVNKAERQRSVVIMVISAIVLIIPSFFQMTKILGKINQDNELKNYVTEVFEQDNIELIDWNLEKTDSINIVNVTIVPDKYIPPDSLKKFKDEFKQNKFAEQCDLKILQLKDPPKNTDAVTLQIKQLEDEMTNIKTKQENQIIELETSLSALQKDTIPYGELEEELKVLFPELVKFGISETIESDFDTELDTLNVLLLNWSEEETKDRKKKAELLEKEAKIKAFIEAKLDKGSYKIIRY